MREQRWSIEKANEWYSSQPWLVGCNFIPSTAINQLEMWQAETFDPDTIDRELGWAADIGFNTMRVFLHDPLWHADADGLMKRMDRYLAISTRRGIRTLFTIFDDCWNTSPRLGPQPAPVPGVHNSGWVQSPGSAIVTDPGQWSRLEKYVSGVLGAFGDDERIIMWDLYNEPGNNKLVEQSLGLLQAVFQWANAARPSQPLTSGVWFSNAAISEFQLAASDVITFHNYSDAANLAETVSRWKSFGRPVICTEYMARTRNSLFTTHLPIFKREHVGCYNWGFVSGKSQTIYPWGSPQGAPEPALWFHDVLRADGTPYDPAEVEFITRLIRE